MLQIAEKSEYPWWWASHIRTKQSKWLENNLREMEETVHNMLKLVEPDADSFAKRAELYFKRRPELIGFVEDAYRAYRALAERYDRISGELQKANRTIATSCPDQVQYAMLEEEDDETFPKAFTPIDPNRINKRTVEGLMKKRRESEEPVRNNLQNKTIASQTDHEAKVQEVISKLQRGILVLESEKQFIQSSYESGIAKYWELEKQIMGLQEEIIRWRDDYSATAVIGDNEARTIMIATTLKSCEDAMASIQQQRIESMEQVKVQSEMIRIAKQKVKALKRDCCESKIECAEVSSGSSEKSFTAENMEKETNSLSKARLELKSVCEKINQYIVVTNPESSVQVAEKVNELLNMVVSLQLTVSSQAAQINRLTSDSNELETNLQKLQEEKMDSIEPTVLTEKVKEAEELLGKLETIKKLVIDEEANFCTNLIQVLQSMDGISEKVSPPKPMEGYACTGHEFVEGEASTLSIEPSRECKDKEIMEIHDIKEDPVEEILLTQPLVQFVQDFLQNEADSPLDNACVKIENPEEINTSGEKRSAVHEVEKKKEDCIRELVTLIGELVNVITMRDEEIQRLRQQLASLKMRPNGSVVELDSEVPADLKSESSSQRSSYVEDSNEEDKSKRDVDSLLGKNLEFWLRFSTTYRYIEQLKAKYAEIQSDISKLENNKTQGGIDGAADYQAAKPESEQVIKRLRELKGELQVWSEQSMLLRGELQRRFLSLNNMKEEISNVVNASSTAGEPMFTSHQAERLKGEVMDMKQETNKASSELLEGLDQVREVQADIEQQLAKLYHNFELIVSKTKSDPSKTGVPLSFFLYGYKSTSCKPKKPSLFARIRPIFQKQKNRVSRR